MATLEEIKKEHETILEQLSNPELISDWEKFEELSQKKRNLEKIIDKNEEIQDLKNKIEENKEIAKIKEDAELSSLAETELKQFQEKKEILEKELEDLLKEDLTSHLKAEKNKSEDIIIEIRAGTGGEEAALFAGNLFKMYSKYAVLQNWKRKVLDSHPSGLGGFKQIIFELKPAGPGSGNNNVFSKMKYEGGVHRVQRIPETEKSGRTHTSTATVAILLKPKATEVKIKPDEIKIDFYHSSGPGGQNVNKRMTAVRISHLSTGLVVTSQNERNQLQNRENALAILSARLLQKKEREEGEKIGGKRKAQIGGAKRAEKIRTYNFPQDRVTDHRIKKTFYNIEGIMEGKLEPIIQALEKNL